MAIQLQRQAVTEPLYKFSGGQPTTKVVVFAKAPFIGAVVYEQRSFRLLKGREAVRSTTTGYPLQG